MILEKEFKKRLLDKLTGINPMWIDGDLEIGTENKASVDLVSHELKIAIEIKDDRQYKIQQFGSNNLDLMNQRFADDIKSANKKFKQYDKYKTILLFRSEYIEDIIAYAISGLDSYKKVDGALQYLGKTTKYKKYIRQEVGCYVIITNEGFYLENPLAKKERILLKQEVENTIGIKLKNIN